MTKYIVRYVADTMVPKDVSRADLWRVSRRYYDDPDDERKVVKVGTLEECVETYNRLS